MQSGVVLLDTETGEVRAIGGWRKSTVVRGFNYATDLKTRQPGSSIKPILDYGPALEYLKWDTYHQMADVKSTYSDGTSLKNSHDEYRGNISIRRALELSSNVVAVKTLQKVGIEKAHNFAKSLGINLDNQIFESAAIGGVVNGPSPFDMAGAYAAFGNEGIYNKPHTVTKVVTMNEGKTINLQAKSVVAMKPSTAYMVSDILKGVSTASKATGLKAHVPGLPMASKTGTTNYTNEEKEKNKNLTGSPDKWFVGYTTKYTASVWVGYGARSTPVKDDAIAMKIYKALMTEVSKGKETPDFKMPSSVVRVPVIKGSNPIKSGNETTPKELIAYELFLRGTEPKLDETYLQKAEIKNAKADFDTITNQIVVTWEFSNPAAPTEAAEFNVSYTIDGGSSQSLPRISTKIIELNEPKPSSTYRFTIKTTDEKSSSDVSITVPDSPIDQGTIIPEPVVPTTQ